MSLRIAALAALSVALACIQVVVAHPTSPATSNNLPEISTNATASSASPSWSIQPRVKCGWSLSCVLDDATCVDNASCSCETNLCECNPGYYGDGSKSCNKLFKACGRAICAKHPTWGGMSVNGVKSCCPAGSKLQKSDGLSMTCDKPCPLV